jgi:hypothetical protein
MHMYFTTRLGSSLPHLFTTLLLPDPLPIVALASLRLLYLLLYSENINHIQILSFSPFPVPPVGIVPFVCDPCPTILLHFLGL